MMEIRRIVVDHPDTADPEEKPPVDSAASLAKDVTPKPTKQRTKTSSIDPRQRTALLKKHVDFMPKLHIPITSATSNEDKRSSTCLCLELASAFASKDVLVSDSKVQQIQSYQRLLSGDGPIVVLMLRSGRFAGGIYDTASGKCLDHRTSARYTVRRGQGKAQSAQDGNRKAQSMGAQLRRHGEVQLLVDVKAALTDWKAHISKCSVILLAVAKPMLKDLYECGIDRHDARLRRIPLDLGRPSFEAIGIALESLSIVRIVNVEIRKSDETSASNTIDSNPSLVATTIQTASLQEVIEEEEEEVPLTGLHLAAHNAVVDEIERCLDPQNDVDVNAVAGIDKMTPLHYAAFAVSATREDGVLIEAVSAAACVTMLLEVGRADPTILDGRRRVPYFLADHDKIRNAFRTARATLGEDYCDWDGSAKVGAALAVSDMDAKREREAEKKRRKRARQKEKKAQEKEEATAAANVQKAQEQQELDEANAKRVRDGLAATSRKSGGGVCDFCQKVCKGRQRTQMFNRLGYNYCTSECVQKHKRELMAAAAAARFGG